MRHFQARNGIVKLHHKHGRIILCGHFHNQHIIPKRIGDRLIWPKGTPRSIKICAKHALKHLDL